MADVVLVETLRLAVPLRIEELAAMNDATRAATVTTWAAEAVEPIASRGDALQFGSKKSGAVAEVFNHLARGLAALAYAPGGVLFAGTHWCAGEHRHGHACISIQGLTCG